MSRVCVCLRSVMSDYLRSHGLQPTRLFCSWDLPSTDLDGGTEATDETQCVCAQCAQIQKLSAKKSMVWGSHCCSAICARPQWRLPFGPGLGFQLPSEKSKCQLLSCVQLFGTPWTVAHQALLSMEFSWQEYWSGLPFPSSGDLPDPGIEPRSPALQAGSLPSEPLGKPLKQLTIFQFILCAVGLAFAVFFIK